MAPSEKQAQQEMQDEKIARQLQHDEEAQVVQGVPVGVPGPTVFGSGDGGLPSGGAVIVSVLPLEELLVLRWRCPLMCFAAIDAFFTLLNLVTSAVNASRLRDVDGEKRSTSWVAFGIGLLFLAGPICGFLGAKRLRTGLVAVYLAFCVVKTALQLMMTFHTDYLWYVYLIGALVQFLVTWIVFTFWRALHALSPEQKASLLDRARGGAAAGVTYW